MSNNHSDALVFFGATGDLADKVVVPDSGGTVIAKRLDGGQTLSAGG